MPAARRRPARATVEHRGGNGRIVVRRVATVFDAATAVRHMLRLLLLLLVVVMMMMRGSSTMGTRTGRLRRHLASAVHRVAVRMMVWVLLLVCCRRRSHVGVAVPLARARRQGRRHRRRLVLLVVRRCR